MRASPNGTNSPNMLPQQSNSSLDYPFCVKLRDSIGLEGICIEQWSLLIDQEQAVLTLSASVGLENADDPYEISITIGFIRDEGMPVWRHPIESRYFNGIFDTLPPFDFFALVSIKNASRFEFQSAPYSIPAKTRALFSIKISCDSIHGRSEQCVFSDLKLVISQKSPSRSLSISRVQRRKRRFTRTVFANKEYI